MTVKNRAYSVFVVLQDPKDYSMVPVSMCTVRETEEDALTALLATPAILKLISDGYKMISNQCHLIPPHIAPMNREVADD